MTLSPTWGRTSLSLIIVSSNSSSVISVCLLVLSKPISAQRRYRNDLLIPSILEMSTQVKPIVRKDCICSTSIVILGRPGRSKCTKLPDCTYSWILGVNLYILAFQNKLSSSKLFSMLLNTNNTSRITSISGILCCCLTCSIEICSFSRKTPSMQQTSLVYYRVSHN